MIGFLRGMWVMTAVELRQRVRGAAWYILLGIFVVLMLIVTGLTIVALGFSDNPGGGLYSTIIYFVLLLGTLVTPALSGNAVNGDRDTGTLATTQVTLLTTTQIVLGKFLAAWLTALAFLAVAIPFLVVSFAVGGARADTIAVSLVVLAVELGVVAAIGVGLSGIIRRPLFSIVATYGVVALLGLGTLIAFGLGGLALQTRYTQIYSAYDPASDPDTPTCLPGEPTEQSAPRFDRVWWILAANPFVVLADAAPTHLNSEGYTTDLFGSIKLGLRSVQIPPAMSPTYSECDMYSGDPDPDYRTPTQIIDSTVPGWFVGLAIHLALAVAALWGAIALTHAPSRRLAPGSRVA